MRMTLPTMEEQGSHGAYARPRPSSQVGSLEEAPVSQASEGEAGRSRSALRRSEESLRRHDAGGSANASRPRSGSHSAVVEEVTCEPNRRNLRQRSVVSRVPGSSSHISAESCITGFTSARNDPEQSDSWSACKKS